MRQSDTGLLIRAITGATFLTTLRRLGQVTHRMANLLAVKE